MFDYLYKNFLRTFQLFFLRLGLDGKNYQNFKDLNFKQNDFINYKMVKYYVLKNNFLNKNKNFSQHKFNLDTDNRFEKFLDNDGDIFCIPSKYNNYKVDGFYSVKFIKNA